MFFRKPFSAAFCVHRADKIRSRKKIIEKWKQCKIRTTNILRSIRSTLFSSCTSCTKRGFSRAGCRTVGLFSSVGTRRKNRIRRVRAAARRKEGLRFGKSAPFPYHPPRRKYPREEDVVSPSSRLSLACDKDGADVDANVGEREEAEERGADLEERRWTRRDKRAGVYARFCTCTRLQRSCASRRERERVRRGENERGGAGVERERDVGKKSGRRRKREREKRRGEAYIPPPRGVKTTPRTRGVSGLDAEANRARPK